MRRSALVAVIISVIIAGHVAGSVPGVIRLFAADGGRAPQALADITDDDHALLLDVLDSDPPSELRADGTYNAWLIDAETVNFLEWNRATAQLVTALRDALRDAPFIEVGWEEVP